MKITEMHKQMGPVFCAQYAHHFETDKTNPYEVGTQAHVRFSEEMMPLEAEEFKKATPAGQAFADYIEGIDDNPYQVGSDEFDLYEQRMIELSWGDK